MFTEFKRKKTKTSKNKMRIYFKTSLQRKVFTKHGINISRRYKNKGHTL